MMDTNEKNLKSQARSDSVPSEAAEIGTSTNVVIDKALDRAYGKQSEEHDPSCWLIVQSSQEDGLVPATLSVYYVLFQLCGSGTYSPIPPEGWIFSNMHQE
ncbi:hypothetical protein AUP68_04381 [Ilyonectria robusta]